VKATASATHEIIAAAEGILGANEDSLESYRARVENNVLTIFEACTFQDITGQRIAKVVDALAQLERRLERFATAVNARDDAGVVPEGKRRGDRLAAVMLNGPAPAGRGIAQDEVDRLFG